jgi:glycosyltransferase involved in cell wall biosynthesis
MPVVYVDSGSVDGSPGTARANGIDVMELDSTRPFSAGRARNEGFERLLSNHPELDRVQFVDGDCELSDDWLSRANEFLQTDDRIAAVCGRVRELHRNRSPYNRLCDIEWDAPVGETAACGGNALYRVAAFREAGGFAPGLLAGEEPDLCFRLSALGWKIFRIADDMVRHDADMVYFAQWWRRTIRSGWGYAQFAWRPNASPRVQLLHENLSIALWGAWLPLATLALVWPTGCWSMVLLVGYPVLGVRVYRRSRRGGRPASDARLEAFFNVIAKFPQAIGQLQFVLFALVGRTRGSIDWRSRK